MASSGTKVNLSYCSFNFEIKNTGTDAIEEFKLLFNFKGELNDIDETNEEDYGIAIISPYDYTRFRGLTLDKEFMAGSVISKKNILVGDDIFISDDIYIKPAAKEYDITIKWKLISKNFKDEGNLQIVVQPQLETDYIDVFTEHPLEAGSKESDSYEEVIVEKNSDS